MRRQSVRIAPMARKRKQKESGLDVLLAAPWWVSAAFAVGGYAAFEWILPAMLASSPLTRMVGQAFKPFSVFVAFGFGLIAVVLYFKQRPSKPMEFVGTPEALEPAFAPASAPAITNPDTVAQAWGELLKKGQATFQRPSEWSLDLLRQIEWKRIEELTAAYFREKTFRTETIRAGADGGIDVKLYVKDKVEPFAIVQCKAWNTQRVGVKPVRELLGVMAHEKVAKGIFVTTGDYTQEAIAFAKENPLNLITGEMLLKGVLALPDDAKARLLAIATEGDYTTPTCPSCGIKMVRRSSDRGAFWGCSNYPRCKQKFFMKAEAA